MNGVWGENEFAVVFTVRYCLGRRDGSSATCAAWIIEYWDKFSENTRGWIKRDVEEAFTRAQGSPRSLGYLGVGDTADQGEWEKVRLLWR